jgi:CheY-like chemotaxis protein
MSPEILKRAFEPFFTTKETGRGTGLGLAQLYGFAKQSAGTARIDSTEGQGTTVTIYLPRTRVLAASGQVTQDNQRKNQLLSVLLVDDDDSVREVCTAMLEDIGCKVVAVPGGAEALDQLKSQQFSLLLTDIAMPAMNGVELVREARKIAPEMPVLFASGYADLQVFADDLAEETVVRKPYRLAEIAARIDAVIAGERADNVVEFSR